MKIAIIHEVSYLSKPVYEYQDFAERLASLGHEVTVFDFDEHTYGPLTRKNVSKTGLASVKLVSLPHIPIPFLGILLARRYFAVEFKDHLRKNSFDVVFLYSVFINGTKTIDLCNAFGIPVIYRLLDAYHRLRKNPLQSLILRRGEKKIYQKSSALLAANISMQRYVGELVGPNHAPCSVLDPGVDTDHFRRLSPSSEILDSLGISRAAIVGVFLGTTYSFSRLDQFIGHIKLIREKVPNFVLLIVGAGELDGAIQKAIITNHLEKCVFTCGMIDYE